MGASNIKGKVLEQAVHAIEGVITSLSIPEGTKITLTLNKIVVIAGVKHEIDLWIEVDGMGIWIVECKNWKDTVGKDVIIVFAEKIRATGANGGFVAARSFSKYAVAQAEQYDNLDLKHVTDDIDLSEYFPHYHVVETIVRMEDSSISLAFGSRKPSTLSGNVFHDGQIKPMDDFTKALLQQVLDERMSHEATAERGGETYTLVAKQSLTFRPGQARLGAFVMNSAELECVFDVRVLVPELTWKFAVEDRGIAASYHSDLSEGYIDAVMVRAAKAST